jgi:ATPase subunit of ABC transporter with duplicated ATPase domains
MKYQLLNPDFLLLDEPSNNLDASSRQALYEFIQQWNKGLIIASHDRQLLAHVDKIIELTPLGVNQYGGNYEDYIQQKAEQEKAIQHQLKQSVSKLENKKSDIQRSLGQHARNTANGLKEKARQIKAKGQYNKIEIKSKQGRSERSLTRINNQANRQLDQLNKELTEAKQQIHHEKTLTFSLDKTKVPSNKQILTIENLSFSYEKQRPLIKNFSLAISGPARIALNGNNGSGKSTLIKLVLQELQPQQGNIILHSKQVAYLDQFCSSLDSNLSVLENFQAFNPEQTITECYQNLAHFKFRNKAALAKVKQLSGGERLRALLACTLMASKPPQLLILDEPTNHLDISSVAYLETVLQEYQGATLIVSHDHAFLERINIDSAITLTAGANK